MKFFSQEITEIPSTQTDEKKMRNLLRISPILNKCHLFLSPFSAEGGRVDTELLLKPIRVSTKTSNCVHRNALQHLFKSFLLSFTNHASSLKREVNIWVTICCCQVKENLLGATTHQCLGLHSDTHITSGDSAAAQAVTTPSLSLTFHTYSDIFQ